MFILFNQLIRNLYGVPDKFCKMACEVNLKRKQGGLPAIVFFFMSLLTAGEPCSLADDRNHLRRQLKMAL